MPTYAYKCKACKREFEKVQKFADDSLVKCPYCKKLKLVRLISSSGLVFKGSGFYLTDYKKRSTTETESVQPVASEKSEKAKPDTPAEDKRDKGDRGDKGDKGDKGNSKSDSGAETKPIEKPSAKKKK